MGITSDSAEQLKNQHRVKKEMKSENVLQVKKKKINLLNFQQQTRPFC
jgi:hypothetical protein